MLRTRQMSLVMTLVIIAVLLAIATFVAIVLIQGRPDPTTAVATATVAGVPIAAVPSGQVVVEGMTVVLDPDPNQAVYIQAEGPPPGQEGLALPPAVVDPSLQAQPPATSAPLPGDPLIPTATIPPAIIEQPVATPLPAATIAPTRDPNPVIIIRYTVQPNDSLYSIATAQNSSIELMALYDIADDHLVPGNVLNLPVANPAYCPGRRAYVVRDIDTLFRIATIFNTTVDTLRSINGIADDNIIEVTQVICVP